MAYICKKKNREGNKVRNRMLKSYGNLEDLEKSEPGIYERLRQEAKAGLLTKEHPKELSVKFDLEEEITIKEQNYGWQILDEIYNNLGINDVFKDFSRNKKIKFALNQVMKLLVFGRILNPLSKSATVSSQKDLFGNWSIKQNDMDRALEPVNLSP